LQSFGLVLDGTVKDETHSIALAKLLVSCLVIRGAQLSVVRRLDSQFVIQVHTGLLTWIGRHLATYEKNQNSKGRKTAALFFRVLLPLLTVGSDDAPKMYVALKDHVLTIWMLIISSAKLTWIKY
jgi:cohesin complex subunit SA-1/2